MACAIHGPASLCGPDCSGFIHSDVPDAPPPAPSPPDDDDFGDMPEGSAYPDDAPSDPSERVGESIEEAVQRALDARLAAYEERFEAMSVQLAKAMLQVANAVASIETKSNAGNAKGETKPDGNARPQ